MYLNSIQPVAIYHISIQLFVTWIIIILDEKIYDGDFNEQGAADSQEFDDYYYWLLFFIWSIYTHTLKSNLFEHCLKILFSMYYAIRSYYILIVKFCNMYNIWLTRKSLKKKESEKKNWV